MVAWAVVSILLSVPTLSASGPSRRAGGCELSLAGTDVRFSLDLPGSPVDTQTSVEFVCDLHDESRDPKTGSGPGTRCDYGPAPPGDGWTVSTANGAVSVSRVFQAAGLLACRCGPGPRVPVVSVTRGPEAAVVYAGALRVTVSRADQPSVYSRVYDFQLDVGRTGATGVCQDTAAGTKVGRIEVGCEEATKTPYFTGYTFGPDGCAVDDDCGSRVTLVDGSVTEPQLQVLGAGGLVHPAVHAIDRRGCACTFSLIPSRGSVDNGVYTGTKYLDVGSGEPASLSLNVANPCVPEHLASAGRTVATVRTLVYRNETHVDPGSPDHSQFSPADRISVLVYVADHGLTDGGSQGCGDTRLRIDRLDVQVLGPDGRAPRVHVYDRDHEPQGFPSQLDPDVLGCGSRQRISWAVASVAGSHGALVSVFVDWTVVEAPATTDFRNGDGRQNGVPDRFSSHTAAYYHHVGAVEVTGGNRKRDSPLAAAERHGHRTRTADAVQILYAGRGRRFDGSGATREPGPETGSRAGTTKTEYSTVCLHGYHYLPVFRYCVRDYDPETRGNLNFWIIATLALVCVCVLYACMICGRRRPRRR